MKHTIITLFTLLFGLQSIISQNETDMLTERRFAINSAILNEERTGFISLPDSYHDSTSADTTYPIIILLDGYVHFKTAAGVVHFLSSSRIRNYLMPETIIIAVENVDRERDLTVTKIKTKRENTMGGGRDFLNFIETELIPYIDKNYRTEPTRTLIGHSLGGLLTVNAYMDADSIFDAYIAIDPSLWWDDPMMTAKVEAITPAVFHKKLFIATANQVKSRYEKNKKKHDRFYNLLGSKSDKKANIKIETFDDENHRTVPLRGLYDGLKFINQ